MDLAVARRRRAISTPQRQEVLAGYLFALPAILVLAIFLVVPIIASIGLAFTDYPLLKPPRWIGLENLRRLVADSRMVRCYGNTFTMAFGEVILANLLGLLLAMGANRKMPRVVAYLFRTAYFFPVLTTTATLALVWQYLLTRDRGIINWLLGTIGIAPIPWLSSSQWAIVSVIIYGVWKSCGMWMVMYLAGLQGIPETLYEAARIDGASRWRLTRHITLPLVTPTAFFCLVMSGTGAFQAFDNVYVLTDGGPGDASRSIALYIYEVAFKRYEMGYASTVALSLMIVLIALTLLQFYGGRRWVHYE